MGWDFPCDPSVSSNSTIQPEYGKWTASDYGADCHTSARGSSGKPRIPRTRAPQLDKGPRASMCSALRSSAVRTLDRIRNGKSAPLPEPIGGVKCIIATQQKVHTQADAVHQVGRDFGRPGPSRAVMRLIRANKPNGYLLGSYRIATAPEPNSSRLTSLKSTCFDSPANNVGPWPAS
jgi:hypothetical protein